MKGKPEGYAHLTAKIDQLKSELAKAVAAEQRALETLEDVFGENKIDVGAINMLRAALSETQMPTKICGPNLVGMLNAAGFYKKKEWVGLTDDEIEHLRNDQPWWMVRDIEAKLREKNGG